jgi:hypothetical protein
MTWSGVRNIFRSISHLLAAIFVNCREFHREWNQYVAVGHSGTSITGRWTGKWLSEVNGHTGKLQCVVTETDGRYYRARFHATYGSALRVCYTVELSVERVNGKFEFEGEADLGKLAGGVYHYRGEVTTTGFVSSYKCSYDQGIFRMSRLD